MKVLRMVTARSSGWSLTVMSVKGTLATLTFRATPDHVQAWLDGRRVADVSRAAMAHWLAGRGPRRPLLDIPFDLRWTDLGVWLEIHGHVAPTLVEERNVRHLLLLSSRDVSRPEA